MPYTIQGLLRQFLLGTWEEISTPDLRAIRRCLARLHAALEPFPGEMFHIQRTFITHALQEADRLLRAREDRRHD